MKGKSFNLDVSDEAENDFDCSYNYYFDQNPKLAGEFFHHINTGLGNIKKSPFTFREVYKGIRKFIVKKFPFVIYFTVDNQTIKIIAIFHTSRNPQIWTGRIIE
jgi:toxin ParE1/3/4